MEENRATLSEARPVDEADLYLSQRGVSSPLFKFHQAYRLAVKALASFLSARFSDLFLLNILTAKRLIVKSFRRASQERRHLAFRALQAGKTPSVLTGRLLCRSRKVSSGCLVLRRRKDRAPVTLSD